MVSVIIPVYKVEQFLNRCVDSVLAQTYQNLEIILVDDGSPDNCGQICEDYARMDPRVKVVHKKNGGLSSARNAGLDVATGKYVAFVDSDDWIEPWVYGKLRQLILEHDADIAEASMRYYRPWKPERLFYQGEYTQSVQVFSNVQALERLYFGPQVLSEISISVCTKLYRRELLKNIRFAEGYFHEDVEFTPRALFYANKVVRYDDFFYNYNIHLGTNSITGQGYSIPKTASALEMKKRIFLFFQEHPLPKISDNAAVAYANAMTHAYYVGISAKTPEGKQLAKPIPKAFRELYPLIRKNPCVDSKTSLQLFRFSPRVYFLVKHLLKAKQARKK